MSIMYSLDFVCYNIVTPLEDESNHNSKHILKTYQSLPNLPSYQQYGFYFNCQKKLNNSVNYTWLKYFEIAKTCFKLDTESVFFNCVFDISIIEPFLRLFPNIRWKALYRRDRFNNAIVANPYDIKSIQKKLKKKINVYISDKINKKPNMYDKFIELATGLSVLSHGGSLMITLPPHGSMWFMLLLNKCIQHFTNVYLCRPSINYTSVTLICSEFSGINDEQIDIFITRINENKNDLQECKDNTYSYYYFSLIDPKVIFRITSALIGMNNHQDLQSSYYKTVYEDKFIRSLLDFKSNHWLNKMGLITI